MLTNNQKGRARCCSYLQGCVDFLTDEIVMISSQTKLGFDGQAKGLESDRSCSMTVWHEYRFPFLFYRRMHWSGSSRGS